MNQPSKCVEHGTWNWKTMELFSSRILFFTIEEEKTDTVHPVECHFLLSIKYSSF